MVTKYRQRQQPTRRQGWTGIVATALAALFVTLNPVPALASEANLVLPDLRQAHFFGLNGHTLLLLGMLLCFGGLAFGLVIYNQLKTLPVHRSMLEVSELIYETCKTYLKTQLKFILLLWVFIAVIMVVYFGFLQKDPEHSVEGLE